MAEIACPICGRPVEVDCGHLVADFDITFEEIHGGILLEYLDRIVEIRPISELCELLVADGGVAVYDEVESGQGFTSQDCRVFSDDPASLIRRSFALVRGLQT